MIWKIVIIRYKVQLSQAYISLDPDDVDIWYFKLWIFGLTEVEVWFSVGSLLEYGTSAVYIYIQKKFETCGDWPFFPTTYKWYTIGFLHTNYNFNRWYKICVYLSLYVMFFFQKRKKCPSQWSQLHNSLERAGKRHE